MTDEGGGKKEGNRYTFAENVVGGVMGDFRGILVEILVKTIS